MVCTFATESANLVGGLDDIARAGERGDDGGGVVTSGLEFGGVRLEGVAHFADVTFLQRIIQVGHNFIGADCLFLFDCWLRPKNRGNDGNSAFPFL